MPFKKTVDRTKATFLRKIGLPYSEISKIVGCSHAWCAAYLRDVKIDYEMIDRLYEVAYTDKVQDLAEILEWSEDDYPGKSEH